MKQLSANVIGLGYIGLPTAATLANANIDVTGIDINQNIVDTINQGNIHITEHGLDILVRAAVQRKRLKASTTIQMADIHIIAVPTPITKDKKADLSYVKEAAKTIASIIKPGDLVILESTVPPATCSNIVGPIIKEITALDHKQDYYLAHCPERVIPGKILNELINNDRIIGGTTPEATHKTAELYKLFVKGELLLTDASTAEMCKLMENTYRDVNIALANELADIAEDIDIDIAEAIKLANHHPRVNIHSPSIGVGGHCIPVDPWFIVDNAAEKSVLIRTAREINDARPSFFAGKILDYARAYPNKQLALLGLSYKADVDDLRESPAIEIVLDIAKRLKSNLLIVEPNISKLPKELELTNLELVDLFTAIKKADKLIILVPHSDFKSVSNNDSIVNIMDLETEQEKELSL